MSSKSNSKPAQLMTSPMPDPARPFSQITVTRVLLLTVIFLAFATGYYAALYQVEQRKYRRLEDMYVRVRGQLGREETQRLIDLSYEQNDNRDW
jgi:hypothetical protein